MLDAFKAAMEFAYQRREADFLKVVDSVKQKVLDEIHSAAAVKGTEIWKIYLISSWTVSRDMVRLRLLYQSRFLLHPITWPPHVS